MSEAAMPGGALAGPAPIEAPAPPAAGPVLILTPTGRDAEGAARLLGSEGIDSAIHPSLDSLQQAVGESTGLVLLADEALFRADLAALAARVARQPPWSDLPFIVLTQSGIAARRQMAEMNLPGRLGNVLFLERPLNALALVSAVKSALRARQRQRQLRAHIEEQAARAARANAELEARVRERTAALETAEAERRQIASALAQAQKMEAVGQLTGGLAHDFNNMLASISGSLELMQIRLEQGRIDQLGRYIGMAQQGAERAAALTHRLLAFSRRQTLDAKATQVNALVEGMLNLVRTTLGPEIAVEVRQAPGLWLTLCDPHQLENALLNLCINARDAMAGGGRLVIETANLRLDAREAGALGEARPGEYVTLSVTDTGSGMSPEVLSRAFDPFFTTKPLGQGTGLGLSMIYGFVQQSGGHVQISSEPGRGTTVRLALPRHQGPEELEPEAEMAQGADPADTQKVILVVDDEPSVRLLVTELLQDLGHVTLEAASGREGLQRLRAAPRIDLLVTDVGMPGGMNGRQLADAARDHLPELRVLFVTGYAEAALASNGILPAGMQVLVKPFAMGELTRRIQELLAP
ncbi:ATP-binding protein [Pseudoroseomonas cervicalis]|uniref:ATP-binding protein n=1 Tax=Teichococcus cervicalis TaxID=204525 RepID=UPI00277DAFF1|nr:ATP-binding protein [Pseudoroseomonas cervicalis]MDQ1079452.1 signal transduction histidine kinase/ActR/RegA family two-component response regulator [Pseudoroseomonas cervicalis]